MNPAIQPTAEQQAIIDCPSNLVAIARPGSGKTFVLTEKIRIALETLKEHQGVIAISYTNKASEEVKRRVRRAGVDFLGSFFGTIDRFCDAEIILPFLPHLWGRPTKEIAVTRIKDLPEDEQEQFANIEANLVSLEVLEEHLELVRKYFENGLLILDMNGALALYTLKHSQACRKYLTARYGYIFVDEYQDSGLEQHELFLELQGLGLVAVAVGDADQSIFGFSGKDSKYLTSLAGLQQFTTFPISFNHRCHPSIINYSLRLLDEDSQLIQTNDLHVYRAHVGGHQSAIAQWINQKVNSICQIFDVGKRADVAILARSTRSAELVDAALAAKHRYFRTHPLEEHSSIWARLFARLLSYHFNDKTTAQEIIDEFGSRTISSEEVKVARKVMKALNQAELPPLQAFIDVALMLRPEAQAQSAVEMLAASLQAGNLSDWFAEPADDEIQVMTLHKAKGLEFDVVFHLDMYEWVLPGKKPGENNDFDHPVYSGWEQDLHLHYVGVTRARKCCVLCSSNRRINSEGLDRQGNPSEFLDLPSLPELRRSITTILPAN